MEWAGEHRERVILLSSIVLAVIVLAVAAGWVYSYRSDKASDGLGAAMQIYQTPIAEPSQPTPPGTKTFASVAERARAANAGFMDVANHYGMTKDGRVARYFAGLTYVEENQYDSAETQLKKVADGWDSNLASLAKLALAQMYRQSGRDQQAVELYNELTAKPTTTVPAGLAQLQLAELYTSEGKGEQAKKVYAALKDKDAKGPAGMLAAQKLQPAVAGQQ
jgi:predicted negative regulator of RcsB-dependent stress response